MERLNASDLRAASGFLGRLYAFRDLDAFVAWALLEIPKLVPSEITVYAEMNLPRRRFMMVETPSVWRPDHMDVFRAHAHEHPLARLPRGGGDGEAVKLSDLLTLRQFRDLGIYQESYRLYGIDREIIFWLPAPPPSEISFGLHRKGPDFSRRDRLLLNVLRPHLIQAYCNAEAVTLLQRAAAADGHATLLLSPTGQLVDQNSRGLNLIAKYFGPSRGRFLRSPLAQWIRHQETMLDAPDDVPTSLAPLVLERDGQRLTVRLFPGPTQRVLLFEERTAALCPALLQALGLTYREAEVITWVAQGKTNDEIAVILGISPRTVAKHLETMYPKLGVENRTAAAARALEALSVRPAKNLTTT